jgi:hypothetical protein
METKSAPQLVCRPLPEFDTNDWDSIAQAFASAEWVDFQQGWLPEPEAAFQQTIVRTGWRSDGLWVYAELNDVDIFNNSSVLNDETYNGDFFEILVRPEVQDSYYEFHVTSNNNHLQLRYPDAKSFSRFDGTHQSLEIFFIPELLIWSQTKIDAPNNKWYVLAKVPTSVAESQKIEAGDVWSFSFSRYDYTQGVEEPVLSSCSPHAAPSYHRQQEWGRLTFVG